MMFEIVDIFFIVSFIAIYLIVLFQMRKNKLTFIKSFILGSIFAILVISWGLIRSDFTSIPVWIQAGATICLLIITAMSTYATMITAQANRDLAEATQKQLIEQTKERRSKIIKEIAQQVFQPILSLLKNEGMAVESGFICVLYSNDKKMRAGSNGFFPSTPELFLQKQIYPPDSFLESRLNCINELNIRFDEYRVRKDQLLERIYHKEQKILEIFGTYCLELKKDTDQFIIPQDSETIFCQILANSKIKGYSGFEFVDANRHLLISKITDLGFSKEIEEYVQLKKELLDIKREYEKTIFALFDDWKREYLLSDSEVKGVVQFL